MLSFLLKSKISVKKNGIVWFLKEKTTLKHFKNVKFFKFDIFSSREELECKRKECRAKEYKPNPL